MNTTTPLTFGLREGETVLCHTGYCHWDEHSNKHVYLTNQRIVVCDSKFSFFSASEKEIGKPISEIPIQQIHEVVPEDTWADMPCTNIKITLAGGKEFTFRFCCVRAIAVRDSFLKELRLLLNVEKQIPSSQADSPSAKETVESEKRSMPSAEVQDKPFPDEKLSSIKEALLRGQKIEAVRLYREYTGAGLTEAKTSVENLELVLLELHTAPPSPNVTQTTIQIVNGILRELAGDNKQFTQAALTAMQTYDWPGGKNELREVISTAVAVSENEKQIGLEHLPKWVTGPKKYPAAPQSQTQETRSKSPLGIRPQSGLEERQQLAGGKRPTASQPQVEATRSHSRVLITLICVAAVVVVWIVAMSMQKDSVDKAMERNQRDVKELMKDSSREFNQMFRDTMRKYEQ